MPIGRKMSKSQGNVVAPQQIMNTLGADILRLWVTAADYRQEMNVSDEILKRVADAYRRIRNTARFLLGNLHDFDPASDAVAMDELLRSIDTPLISPRRCKTRSWPATATIALSHIYQRVHHFCSVDMGAFYLDIIKDRLYTLPKDHPGASFGADGHASYS